MEEDDLLSGLTPDAGLLGNTLGDVGGALEGADTELDDQGQPIVKPVTVADLQAKLARVEQKSADDVRFAVLEAKLAAAEERSKGGYNAPPPQPQYSKEQIAEYNEKILTDFSANPLGFLERFKAGVLEDARQMYATNANPALGNAAEMMIDGFITKQSKGIPDSAYVEAVKVFESEMDEIDRASLMSMTREKREKELKRIWTSAIGQVAIKSYQNKPAPVRTLGGGTTGGTPGRGGSSKLAKIAAGMGYTEIQAARFLKTSKLTEDEALQALG